jgi:hypothetical protein
MKVLRAKTLEATILYNESKHNILALVGKPNKGIVCQCGVEMLLLDWKILNKDNSWK